VGAGSNAGPHFFVRLILRSAAAAIRRIEKAGGTKSIFERLTSGSGGIEPAAFFVP
jgi:hypothetical protein